MYTHTDISAYSNVYAVRLLYVMNSVNHPLTAIAMAMSDSVTVSIGDETSGVFIVICLVSADVRSYKESQTKLNPIIHPEEKKYYMEEIV